MKFVPITFILAAAALFPAAAWAGDASVSTISFGIPTDAQDLEAQRGRAGTTFNDMNLQGTTSNNSADHVQTGNNVITDGAFANLSGIPVVIQNSGANVLIQNAVILNLTLQ